MAEHTQRFRTERRSVRARSPPLLTNWGRSLIPALHEIGMKDFVLAGLLVAAVSCIDALGFSEQSAGEEMFD